MTSTSSWWSIRRPVKYANAATFPDAASEPHPRRLAALVAALSANPQALFPSDVLGKTFVWDTQTSAYVMGTATGAPATGIRIVLYFTNAGTGEPFLPLSPIGSLDLTDKSTPRQIAG